MIISSIELNVKNFSRGNQLTFRRGDNSYVLGCSKGEESEQWSKDFHIVASLEKTR